MGWILFLLYAQSITVISPNGGEMLYSGDIFEIKWNATDDIKMVMIAWSSDGGKNWELIGYARNEGRYLWSVPLASCDAKILVMDVHTLLSDTSETFSITRPVGTLFHNWPIYPHQNKKVTSNFCDYRSDHLHGGLDVPPENGASVVSPTLAYKVIYKKNFGGSTGHIVKIQHYAGSPSSHADLGCIFISLHSGSRYIHMIRVNVEKREELYIGDPIGSADRSNFTYPPHLHYEYRRYDVNSGDLTDFKNPLCMENFDVDDDKSLF